MHRKYRGYLHESNASKAAYYVRVLKIVCPIFALLFEFWIGREAMKVYTRDSFLATYYKDALSRDQLHFMLCIITGVVPLLCIAARLHGNIYEVVVTQLFLLMQHLVDAYPKYKEKRERSLLCRPKYGKPFRNVEKVPLEIWAMIIDQVGFTRFVCPFVNKHINEACKYWAKQCKYEPLHMRCQYKPEFYPVYVTPCKYLSQQDLDQLCHSGDIYYNKYILSWFFERYVLNCQPVERQILQMFKRFGELTECAQTKAEYEALIYRAEQKGYLQTENST